MSFLTAEWRRLAIANYQVDKEVLEKYLPYKTELDLWNNSCYVSLVGFQFLKTKVMGMPIPIHRNFEEVNLRFYVRHKDNDIWKRGVVFIKEIVPKPAITWVANTVYNEHYETRKMRHRWEQEGDTLVTEYSWKHQNKWQKFNIRSELSPERLQIGSETEFVTEHYWGYSKQSAKKTTEYEVTHPKWDVYPIKDATVNVAFDTVYGNDFKHLNLEKPVSVMLAEGSLITVETKKTLK